MARRIDYQAKALALLEAERSGRPLVTALRRTCPGIVKQLEVDAQHRPLLDLWGHSLNFDEFAKVQIVSPGIMAAIGELAGVTCEGEVIHAGLQHTYGYLFSVIETPYGFKRTRWINDTIETGLGIKQPALRPWSTGGSMLANVTYFLGRIAFRSMSKELALLRRHRSVVTSELTSYPFSRLKVVRVTELVELPESGNVIAVHLDFVQFDHPTASAEHLLVYSIVDSRDARGSLITAFPVSRSMRDEYLSDDSLGTSKPIRTRFNAYVEDWTGRELLGERIAFQ